MIKVKPLSQRDPEWKNILLGFNTDSQYTIGGYGCLLLCEAMASNYYGRKTNPKKLNKKLKDLKNPSGFVDGGYYVFHSITRIYPEIKEERRITSSPLTDGQMNEIFSWLDSGYPVMLHIDMFPETAIPDMHFVLAVGYNKNDENDIMIADPWTGDIRSLHTYLRKYKTTARGTIEQYIGFISEPPASFLGNDTEASAISILNGEIKLLETNLATSVDEVIVEKGKREGLEKKIEKMNSDHSEKVQRLQNQLEGCQDDATEKYLKYEDRIKDLIEENEEGGAKEMPRNTLERGKALVQSKSFWFNALSLLVAVATLFGFGTFEPSPEISKTVMALSAVVNIILRLRTSQPIIKLK